MASNCKSTNVRSDESDKAKLVRSDDDIYEAINMWQYDPVGAKIKYGDISEWDTSRVTMHKFNNCADAAKAYLSGVKGLLYVRIGDEYALFNYAISYLAN
jgi:hypothetical protein